MDYIIIYQYSLSIVVVQSCPTLCDPVDMPTFPVLHYLPKFERAPGVSDGQPTHPTISSSVILLSSCLQSFPASGSFLVNWLFASGGQSIGASTSVLPMNIQAWLPLGFLTSLISLLSKGLSRIFSSTTVWKHQFVGAQSILWSNSHICTWLLEKP